MRSCEIKAIRWIDVDMDRSVISVPVSKSAAGCRAIPINATLREALGPPGAPEEYVVYSIRGKRARPLEPAKTWKRAWASLCRAAGLPGLHFHALRHQAITELLEHGTPESVVQSIAGHVSKRMMDHYSHPRIAAKASAVAGLGCV
jgi:integrase